MYSRTRNATAGHKPDALKVGCESLCHESRQIFRFVFRSIP